PWTMIDDRIGTAVCLLPSTGEGGIEARRQILETNARSVRIGVAAQHPHKPGTVRAGCVHADKSCEGFARAMRETVEIAGDRQFLRAHARKAGGHGATLSRHDRRGCHCTLTANGCIVTVRTNTDSLRSGNGDRGYQEPLMIRRITFSA